MAIVGDVVVTTIIRGHQRGKRTVSFRERGGEDRKLTGQARVTL